jgi:erythromycin esterase-like protein
MYNLNASVKAVLDYLDKIDPEAARVARERYGCLTPWQSDPSTHGRAALSADYAPCEKPVIGILRNLLEKHLQYAAADGESFLDAAQNAGLVASAERYYRVMYYGSAESWNLRDRHTS